MWNTYVVAITLQNLPKDPDQLLVLTQSTIIRDLRGQIAFFDESCIQERLEWVDCYRMRCIERIQQIRDQNSLRDLSGSVIQIC